MLHNEIHDIPPLAASETLIYAFGGRYGKRAGLFIMKRTAADIIDSSFLQTDKIGNYFVYICGIKYLLYGRLINHATKIAIIGKE